MADASLNIPITADASKFLSTLGQVEDRLKELKLALKDAVGGDIAKINFDIQGLEQQKSAIKDFGKFAEGTYGSLLQQLNNLRDYQLTLKYDGAEFKQVQADIDATKAKIKDLTSTPKEIKVEFEPPQGSIAALKKQISELEFMKSIQVDTTAIEQYANLIKGIKSELKSLENIGIEIPAPTIVDDFAEDSILGLRKKIDELNAKKIRIGVKNEGEISKLNSEIKGLEQEIKKANDLTIDDKGGISKNANKARQTITNLKLVAQDLPFGFIAIQNNIPNLLESFGDLNTKSDGLKGTFKELGKQLVGPAGIFLAFSVVTAAVTYAVQKYGSLGNAIKVLTGNSTELDGVLLRSKDTLEKYNKELKTTREITAQAVGSTAGQVEKINILSKAIKDVNLSETQRGNALKELQELDPKNLENIKLNTQGYKDLDEWVKKYTDSLVANAVAQEYIAKIAAVTTEINQQQIALQGIAAEYDILALRRKKALDIIAKSNDNGDLQIELLGPIEGEKLELDKKFFSQANAVSALNKQLSIYRDELTKATNESIKFFRNTGKDDDGGGNKNVFVPKIDVQDPDEFTNLDKIIKRVEKYGNAFIDINNSVAERSDALKKLLEVDPQYFKTFSVGSKDVDTAREAIEQLLRTLNSKKLFEKQREEGRALNNLWEKQARDREEALEKIQKAADDEYMERMFKNDTFNYKAKLEFTAFDADLEKAVGTVNSAFKSLEDVFNDVFENIVSKNQQIANSIEGYITQPMQTLFDILTNEGEASWKDFGKVVIDVLKKIAIQAISTAIAKTLANILAPGFGTISDASLFDYLDNPPGDFDLNMLTGGGRRRGSNNSANFGGIVGSQSMQMAGQVNMVIRGSDLVGVMNRTNTTINRVG
jgi:hypothetical protein